MATSDSRRERGRESGHAPTLASTLVTYADRPDRRTVYPPGTNSVARMSTWLTADADAFVDLDEVR